MISEVVKVTLGLIGPSVQMGNVFVHNCEILLWPVSDQQKVYVADCDYEGNPLPEGRLMVFTFWKIGLKFAKEVNTTEDALLDYDIRQSILKEILL